MTDQHVHQLTEGDVSGPADGRQVAQIIPDLNRRYGEALRKFADEPVRYEVFMFPLPTEQTDLGGNRQLVGMIGFYLEAKGAIIGTQISGTRIMQANGHSDEVVEAHVRETLSSLLEARSQQLAQAQRDAQAAAERGEQPPVSGLIMPNGTNPTFDDMERATNGFLAGQ